MNDENGGMPCSVQFAIMIIGGVLAMLAASVILPDDGGARTTTNTTRNDVRVLSDNDVRIFSPETNVYLNSGNTGDTTSVVDGDRNNVVQQQPGCWVSSAQAWGACPEGVPAGAAVP